MCARGRGRGQREREGVQELSVCGGGCRSSPLTSIIWTHRPELMTRVRHRGSHWRCRWRGGPPRVASGHAEVWGRGEAGGGGDRGKGRNTKVEGGEKEGKVEEGGEGKKRKNCGYGNEGETTARSPNYPRLNPQTY